MADFIPHSDDNLISFYDTQVTKLPTQGAVLGIAAAQITATTAACSDAQGAIFAVETAKQALASAVADKEAKVAAANLLVRDSAGEGKESNAYTEAIGQDLKWIAGGTPFDPNTYKAVIWRSAASGPAEVTLDFRKASGAIDGVNVYMRRQGQTAWTFLNLRLRSPYIDQTPLAAPGVAEVREYRIRGVLKDVEIGLFSDVVVLTVA